jgi:hypothetical protein
VQSIFHSNECSDYDGVTGKLLTSKTERSASESTHRRLSTAAAPRPAHVAGEQCPRPAPAARHPDTGGDRGGPDSRRPRVLVRVLTDDRHT